MASVVSKSAINRYQKIHSVIWEKRENSHKHLVVSRAERRGSRLDMVVVKEARIASVRRVRIAGAGGETLSLRRE